MTERSWAQTPTMEFIFQAPFIWIKAWNQNCGKTLAWHCCMCYNPANGRVDFEEWSAYKIQLHGIEWIVSLSADWDQSSTKKTCPSYQQMHRLPMQRCTQGGEGVKRHPQANFQKTFNTNAINAEIGEPPGNFSEKPWTTSPQAKIWATPSPEFSTCVHLCIHAIFPNPSLSWWI